MCDLTFSEIKVILAEPKDGFLGFVSFVLNDAIFIGNVAIYQSVNRQEGFRLVFPDKKSLRGEVYKIVFPINKESYQAVVNAVEKKLREAVGPLLGEASEKNCGEEVKHERQGERDTR